ncbi:MAG: DUF1801 domain-containing protein [Gordonibacter sp.]|nr:DUF1801 domain-containing protein [Gordonibacter sp.]
MWICPRCDRTFKNTDQDHFCIDLSEVDEYIAEQPNEVQPLLQSVRSTIRAAAPDAIEKISWRMPTFWQGENLVHFAAFKKHIGIYPGSEAMMSFADRLKGYKTSKGALQLPLNKPLDLELVGDLTRWRVRQVEERARS